MRLQHKKINKHTTINMIPIDASNQPDLAVNYVKSTKATSNLEVSDYIGNADKRNKFSKRYTSNWNSEIFKITEVLKTPPPTYN